MLGVMKMLMCLWFEKTYASEPQSISKNIGEMGKGLAKLHFYSKLGVQQRIFLIGKHQDLHHFCVSLVYDVCGRYYQRNTLKLLFCLWKLSSC